ncbi:MAG: hydrogenase maturation protease [Thermoplasmata archaeon]|nr:hydrogenase maturation protease [Thermoplasmata archaeon]
MRGAPSFPRAPLVIGLGNERRGDDAVGLLVATAVRERLGQGARVFECSGDLTKLLDMWADEPTVFVVDAVVSGSAPGTVHVVDLLALGEGSATPVTSTHGVSLSGAVALGRALGRLPGELFLYGVEASQLSIGSGVGRHTPVAIAEVTERLVTALRAAEGGRTAVGSRKAGDA